MVVTVSHLGYIKRNPLSEYRAQRRGGKGVKGMEAREEDFVERLFVASTHAYILFFTTRGRVHWLKVHELPQLGRAARGKALVNLLQLARRRARARDAAGAQLRRGRRRLRRAVHAQSGVDQEDAASTPTRTRGAAASSRSTSTRTTS